MLRSFQFRLALAPLAALLAFSTFGREPVQGDVAFKISGDGVGLNGLPLPGQPARSHQTVGQATHLGRYTADGTVKTDSAVIDFANGVITGEFGSGSPYVFTAADGSKLATWYGRTDHGASTPGTFTLTILGPGTGGLGIAVQAHWIAEFVIDPAASTGRFRGATGSWIMDAYSEPFVLGSDDPVYYSWSGQGRIKLK